MRKVEEKKDRETVEKTLAQERELAREVIQFLKEKDISYGTALRVLKDAQSLLEWASLKNKL